MKTDLIVQPDPAFTISDADRTKRNTAITSAYKLQQQLAPARDALVALNKQLIAMRQYLTAAGDAGKAALAQVEKADGNVTETQGALNRTLNSARAVQTAMDGYDGLPTEAQLHPTPGDWALGGMPTANASALNKIIGEAMPSVYSAIGGTIQWPRVSGVAILRANGERHEILQSFRHKPAFYFRLRRPGCRAVRPRPGEASGIR